MKTEKSKNLVVIIGNGFDLAHDLKTSYNDFANYYLNEVIFNELIKLNSKEETSIIKKDFIAKYNKSKPAKFGFLSSPELSDNIKINLIISYIMKNDVELLKDSLDLKNSPPLKKLIYNSFLCNLYNNKYENWFDIEQAYYDELLNVFHDKDDYVKVHGESKTERIDILNQNLEEIKHELNDYLNNVIKPFEDKNVYYSFSQHFKERKNISFINFNYTDTVTKYFRLKNDSDLLKYSLNIKNIHVHNSLNDNIIFGYGDDTDEEYQKIKMAKNDEFLRNFKTFNYLKSKNYRRVLNELTSFKDGYDVLVIGHSLGLTDKTILKQILDNTSCQNIELLKRSDLKTEEGKEESHFKLYANLSRIFSLEGALREKVIPFEWSVNFPKMVNGHTSKIHEREKELYKEPPTVMLF
jgi:hypothetical protein